MQKTLHFFSHFNNIHGETLLLELCCLVGNKDTCKRYFVQLFLFCLNMYQLLLYSDKRYFWYILTADKTWELVDFVFVKVAPLIRLGNGRIMLERADILAGHRLPFIIHKFWISSWFFLGFLPEIFGISGFLPEMFRISSGDVLDLFWRCFRFLPEFAELGNGQIMPANERAEILAGHWLPFIIRLRTGLKFPERTL